MGPRVKRPHLPLTTSFKYHQTPHDELNYLDTMTEKSEANVAATPSAVLTAHQQQVLHGRQSGNRLIGHHHHHQPSQPTPPQQPPPPSHHQPAQPPHNQQPPLHHNRSGSSLSVTDYRVSATTPTVNALEPDSGAVGRRPPAVNGSVSNVLCSPRPAPQPPVVYPRPMYRLMLPLTTPLWHHAPPHFPTSGVPFQPFMEGPSNDWNRHRRLPVYNQELQPGPVNLQNNHHHRRPEPGRALEIADRLQQERVIHSRPAPANPPAHDDREQTRHHA